MAEEAKTGESVAQDKGNGTETKTDTKAEKSFEELLREWDAAEEKSAKEADKDDEEAEEKPAKKAESLQDKARKLREAKAQQPDPEVEELLLEKRRQEFVKDIRRAGGDGLKNVDDEFLLDLALGRLSRDGRLEKAFVNRKQQPKPWNEGAKIIAAGVVERLGTFRTKQSDDGEDDDPGLTRDPATQAAARAAARATETRKTAQTARSEEDEKVMAMAPGERLAYWHRKGIRLGI